MTEIYPITPPPELVQEWMTEIWHEGTPVRVAASDLHIANQAAHWGADMELDRCIQYFHEYDPSWGEDSELISGLRATRRPKPPSLKEQALDSWDRLRNEAWCEEIDFDLDFIRRALESLPD